MKDQDPRTVRDYDPVRAQKELEEAADKRLKAAHLALQAAVALDPKVDDVDPEERKEALELARTELRDAREAAKAVRIFGPNV